MATAGNTGAEKKSELRRDVTVWGSYTWCYADVGADIYAALGLVIAASQGSRDGFRPVRYHLHPYRAGVYRLSSTYRSPGAAIISHYRFRRFWGFVAGRAFCSTILSISLSLPFIRRLYQLFFLPAVVGINVSQFVIAWAFARH